MTPPFERTSCACSDCASCCKVQPGFLIPSDVQKIADYMQLPVEQCAQTYLRKSPGALVADVATGRKFYIGSIVPAPDDSGRCVFLDTQDRCLIHPVSPFGCSMFDTHMNAPDAIKRTTWALRLMSGDTDYQQLRDTLQPAASWRPFAR